MNFTQLKNEICEQTESILASYWSGTGALTQLGPRRLSNRIDPQLIQRLSSSLTSSFGLRSYRYGSRRRYQRPAGGNGACGGSNRPDTTVNLS